MKVLTYLLTLAMGSKVLATVKNETKEETQTQVCNEQVSVVIIKENDYLNAVRDRKILFKSTGDKEIIISDDLYSRLKESGNIKVLKSLISTNCGTQDCSLK